MPAKPSASNTIAVIGAGMSGLACAASLHAAGQRVSLFDKSRGVGGRMATRRVALDGAEAMLGLDHGAPAFAARRPRFRSFLARAESRGVVQRWSPRLHAAWPARPAPQLWVPQGDMPALCRHLLADMPLQLQQTVQRMQHGTAGWTLHTVEGQRHGPYSQVVLAMPPAQAAALLAGHHDGWAETLRAVPMVPCWTLMAVGPDVDWPWDACEPSHGPLARVLRNDRKPGRSTPAGLATWVAHATPEWSAAHLEDSPQKVEKALGDALAALLPAGKAAGWQHLSVHRWRYARELPASASAAGSTPAPDCWWDATLGLGVCGDFLGGGGVEGAWHSGDELADTVLAWLDLGGQPVYSVQRAA
jgi:renalase